MKDMTTDERTLFQFPISHYCEKTRWNLDAKGLSYKVRNLLPGVHVPLMKRLAGVRTVPVLLDRGTAVGDSTSIALHLEDAYPEPPLLPRDEAERARALEIEDHFDRKVGTAVRQWIYGQLMLAGPGRAVEVMLGAYPLPARVLGKIAAPILERGLRKMYRIDASGVASAHARILDAADRIEALIGHDPSRYLVGGALSLADIAAASLLGPIVGAPESPYARGSDAMPEPVRELRKKLLERAAGQWVMARYKSDRRRRASSSTSQASGGKAHA